MSFNNEDEMQYVLIMHFIRKTDAQHNTHGRHTNKKDKLGPFVIGNFSSIEQEIAHQ